MTSPVIRMGKSMVECFVAKMNYNGNKVEVLLVPQFGNKPGWVGPGYWQPNLDDLRLRSEPPAFNYNTKVYTREELVAAGAKQKLEHLWMR